MAIDLVLLLVALVPLLSSKSAGPRPSVHNRP